MPIRFEKRQHVGRLRQLAAIGIALATSLLITAILVYAAGADVTAAFASLYQGAIGDKTALINTLIVTTPILLTSEAAVLAFRGNIWNIGLEGQLYAGAMFAYWIYASTNGIPAGFYPLIIILGGFIGGGILGFIPGILKSKFQVDVIISTVMLNYVIAYFLDFLLGSSWRVPGSFYYQTALIDEKADLPLLINNPPLHMGFLVALIMAGAVYIILKWSRFGYKIRAIGENPRASLFKGINAARTITIALILSGGVAGLAGAIELFGLRHRLRSDLSPGFGWTGMMIAMLAGRDPIIAIPAALFFGALENGSLKMQITTGVPTSLVDVLQALVVFLILGSQVIANYRLRRVAYEH
ncbi:MAG: ABC transporter permease [Anaerolineales bacterium]